MQAVYNDASRSPGVRKERAEARVREPLAGLGSMEHRAWGIEWQKMDAMRNMLRCPPLSYYVAHFSRLRWVCAARRYPSRRPHDRESLSIAGTGLEDGAGDEDRNLAPRPNLFASLGLAANKWLEEIGGQGARIRVATARARRKEANSSSSKGFINSTQSPDQDSQRTAFSSVAVAVARLKQLGSSWRQYCARAGSCGTDFGSIMVATQVVLTVLFVLPFYASSTTRPSQTLTRDAPSVIKARLRALTFSCSVSVLITVYVASQYGHLSLREILHLLGWWPIFPLDIFKSLLLVMALFAGPLFETGIVDEQLRAWLSGTSFRETLRTWIGVRNYIAAPLLEELFFRSILTPLHLLSLPCPPPLQQTRPLVFTIPLYFGIAHLHHLYEFRLRHPAEPFALAVARSLVQFAYTSLFGWIAEFIFLRTGSLVACVVAHSFCNAMGLPRVWGRVGREKENVLDEWGEVGDGGDGGVVVGPPGIEGKLKKDGNGDKRKEQERSDGTNVQMTRSTGLGNGWTVAYYFLLVGGAVQFWRLLYPLTSIYLVLGLASKSPREINSSGVVIRPHGSRSLTDVPFDGYDDSNAKLDDPIKDEVFKPPDYLVDWDKPRMLRLVFTHRKLDGS
ncbi:MAG: hypothetical protein M1822_010102 [Bathelium mastoideum]|nr:MAG: hypothetical protein M1822_010102 [Bathelium mastoideum]